jgi:hypothetical protein
VFMRVAASLVNARDVTLLKAGAFFTWSVTVRIEEGAFTGESANTKGIMVVRAVEKPAEIEEGNGTAKSA